MNDALRSAALLALDAANAIVIERFDQGRFFVLDTSKAEPEVNWPGESLSLLVSFEEAKEVRDTARAERLCSLLAEIDRLNQQVLG